MPEGEIRVTSNLVSMTLCLKQEEKENNRIAFVSGLLHVKARRDMMHKMRYVFVCNSLIVSSKIY